MRYVGKINKNNGEMNESLENIATIRTEWAYECADTMTPNLAKGIVNKCDNQWWSH